MRYGNLGWREFNAMTPAESRSLHRALTELLKQEAEFEAALAGARRGG